MACNFTTFLEVCQVQVFSLFLQGCAIQPSCPNIKLQYATVTILTRILTTKSGLHLLCYGVQIAALELSLKDITLRLIHDAASASITALDTAATSICGVTPFLYGELERFESTRLGALEKMVQLRQAQDARHLCDARVVHVCDITWPRTLGRLPSPLRNLCTRPSGKALQSDTTKYNPVQTCIRAFLRPWITLENN